MVRGLVYIHGRIARHTSEWSRYKMPVKTGHRRVEDAIEIPQKVVRWPGRKWWDLLEALKTVSQPEIQKNFVSFKASFKKKMLASKQQTPKDIEYQAEGAFEIRSSGCVSPFQDTRPRHKLLGF